MGEITVLSETFTWDNSTGGTETSVGYIKGSLKAVQYVGGGTLSSTADLTIKTTGGQTLLDSLAVGTTAGFVKYPVATVVNTTNAAVTAYESIPIGDERIKITVAATTSASQSGTFKFYYEGA